MKIDQHISELLFQYDCVIIPNFGGFVANYAPAQIHPTQHTFSPPAKRIGFNKSLKNNDGLLANQISHKQGVSFSEANLMIASFVDACEKQLKEAKKVDLQDVGLLFLDVEHHLQFESHNTVNYLTDSFGLCSFQSPAIKRDNYQVRIEKQFKDRTVIPSEGKKINVKKYVALALCIPVAIALVWIPLKTDLLKNVNSSNLNPFAKKATSEYVFRTLPKTSFTEADFKEVNSLANDTSKISALSFTDDATKPITVKLSEESVKKQETDKTMVVQQNTPSDTPKTFHVIGGCFSILSNADAFVKQLESKNIKAQIIGQNNAGLYIVSYGDFSKREEAVRELALVKMGNPNAWLLKR